MNVTLYKRNSAGIPIEWNIYDIDGKIYIKHGGIGFTHTPNEIVTNRDIEAEIRSCIEQKRKAGYKELKDLYDNAPESLSTSQLYNYLNAYLPKANTDANGNIIPMLCKTLEDNKPFEKYSYMGSWKINGERCIVGMIANNDLFGTIHLTYHSRTGEDWTNKLNYLDEYLLDCIPDTVRERMIEEGAELDGELYIPGYKINEINSIIKNVNHKEHYNLQLWLYDICIDEMSAVNRYFYLYKHFNQYIKQFDKLEDHLNNKDRLVLLPQVFDINSYSYCASVRDKYIDLGFEGIVIRNVDADYQFGGKRNMSMLKFKKILDGKFKIVDIIPTSEKQKDLGKFILQNDINDQLFECVANASHDAQREYLINKNNYIGKYALVEYRERSGVNNLPFHARIVKLFN